MTAKRDPIARAIDAALGELPADHEYRHLYEHVTRPRMQHVAWLGNEHARTARAWTTPWPALDDEAPWLYVVQANVSRSSGDIELFRGLYRLGDAPRAWGGRVAAADVASWTTTRRPFRVVVNCTAATTDARDTSLPVFLVDLVPRGMPVDAACVAVRCEGLRALLTAPRSTRAEARRTPHR